MGQNLTQPTFTTNIDEAKYKATSTAKNAQEASDDVKLLQDLIREGKDNEYGQDLNGLRVELNSAKAAYEYFQTEADGAAAVLDKICAYRP